MILLDIVNNNNLCDELQNDAIYNTTHITLKFINKYEDYNYGIKGIIDKPLEKDEIIEVKCSICDFLGSGSYGKVFKIKIGKKYYAFKISENEKPHNFKMRYESLISVDKMKKYVIDVYVAGNFKCGKYSYFSIMEYGGHSLKSVIPINDPEILDFILRQLYNVSYLCLKHRLTFTDFKLNNCVVNSEYRLKLIDLYIECGSYSPCQDCRVVKTYSPMEIDKMKGILDDADYNHSYLMIPLCVGLIDLVCKKSASHIITHLGQKHGIYLGVKQMIPLIQISCFNYKHKSNESIKEYGPVYTLKKKLEKKYPDIKKQSFYEHFLNSLVVRDEYKNTLPIKKFQMIVNCLLSAHPKERTIEPLKKHLNENQNDS